MYNDDRSAAAAHLDRYFQPASEQMDDGGSSVMPCLFQLIDLIIEANIAA